MQPGVSDIAQHFVHGMLDCAGQLVANVLLLLHSACCAKLLPACSFGDGMTEVIVGYWMFLCEYMGKHVTVAQAVGSVVLPCMLECADGACA